MSPTFTVFIHVGRSIDEVYEAVADPAILSRYFTTGGAKGRLETGATVTWEFHDFPGGFPVEIVEAVKNRKIVLRWEASENGPAGYRTTVTFVFEPIDAGARTKVSVSEEGWRETEAGRAASYMNCMGWSQMLAALKMWVEHGINLREGAYK
ncbi:MAG: SRPBCC domain-containing protein [Parvularculaceae bacterium]